MLGLRLRVRVGPWTVGLVPRVMVRVGIRVKIRVKG